MLSRSAPGRSIRRTTSPSRRMTSIGRTPGRPRLPSFQPNVRWTSRSKSATNGSKEVSSTVIHLQLVEIQPGPQLPTVLLQLNFKVNLELNPKSARKSCSRPGRRDNDEPLMSLEQHQGFIVVRSDRAAAPRWLARGAR